MQEWQQQNWLATVAALVLKGFTHCQQLDVDLPDAIADPSAVPEEDPAQQLSLDP